MVSEMVFIKQISQLSFTIMSTFIVTQQLLQSYIEIHWN